MATFTLTNTNGETLVGGAGTILVCREQCVERDSRVANPDQPVLVLAKWWPSRSLDG